MAVEVVRVTTEVAFYPRGGALPPPKYPVPIVGQEEYAGLLLALWGGQLAAPDAYFYLWRTSSTAPQNLWAVKGSFLSLPPWTVGVEYELSIMVDSDGMAHYELGGLEVFSHICPVRNRWAGALEVRVRDDYQQYYGKFDRYERTGLAAFTDEFNGSALDPRWTKRHELYPYTSGRVEVAGGYASLYPENRTEFPASLWIYEEWSPSAVGATGGDDQVATMLSGHKVVGFVDSGTLKCQVYEPGEEAPTIVTISGPGVTDTGAVAFMDALGQVVVVTQPSGAYRFASTRPWDSGSWGVWSAT